MASSENKFSNNFAKINGGAIYNSSGTLELSSKENEFKGNKADGLGGAIFNNKMLTISSGTMLNISKLDNTGTITVENGTLSLTGSAGFVTNTGTIPIGNNYYTNSGGTSIEELTKAKLETIDAVLNISANTDLSKVTFNKDAMLEISSNVSVTDFSKTKVGVVQVDKEDGNLSVSGNSTFGILVNKGTVAIKDTVSADTITNNGIVNVGNSTSAGSLIVNALSGSDTIFVDPTWEIGSGSIEKASNLAVETRSADSSIVIGQNSIGILGSSNTDDAVSAFNDTGAAWGNPDSDPDNIGAVLIIARDQVVNENSALVVDSSYDELPNLSDYKNAVTVGSQSMLIVNDNTTLTTKDAINSGTLSATAIENSGSLTNSGTLETDILTNSGILTNQASGILLSMMMLRWEPLATKVN